MPNLWVEARPGFGAAVRPLDFVAGSCFCFIACLSICKFLFRTGLGKWHACFFLFFCLSSMASCQLRVWAPNLLYNCSNISVCGWLLQWMRIFSCDGVGRTNQWHVMRGFYVPQTVWTPWGVLMVGEKARVLGRGFAHTPPAFWLRRLTRKLSQSSIFDRIIVRNLDRGEGSLMSFAWQVQDLGWLRCRFPGKHNTCEENVAKS